MAHLAPRAGASPGRAVQVKALALVAPNLPLLHVSDVEILDAGPIHAAVPWLL